MQRRRFSRRRFAGAGTLLSAAMLCALTTAACNRNTSGQWFEKPKTSQEWLTIALEAKTADERRQGIVGLARGRDGQSDWAMKVYETVARTDSDTMVRCAAVHAMWPAASSPQVPLLFNLLDSTANKHADVRPAEGPVRWEAAKVLLAVIDNVRYQESQRPEIVKMLLDRLARDPDRQVRLTVIDALAYFAEQPIPKALVDVLEEDDFSIRRAAEQSLIALTGVTFNHDAKAWRQWLASAKDPFENAGQKPATSQPAGKSRRWTWDLGF